MSQDINRKINIYINGKAIRNTVNGVGKELRKLRGQLNNLTRGSAAYNKKALEIKRAQEEYSKMRKEVDLLTGSVRRGSKGIGSFVKAFAGGFAIGNIITSVGTFFKNTIEDSIQLAEEAKGVNFAFKQIEGNIELLERSRNATRGLISDLDIKKAANSFAAFRLDLEPFPELLQFVSTRAAQTGGNFDNMLNSLVEGLSKESKLRIDNLGISQLQLNNELEKTPNFVQAVANIAKRELVGAGTILDEAANANQKWNVALENAKLRLGQIAQSSGVTSFFQTLGSSILDTLIPLEDLNKNFELQAQKVINIENQLPGLISEYDDLKAKASLNTEEQNRLKTIIEKIGKIVPTSITAFDDYGNALDISSAKAENYIDVQKALLKITNTEALNEQQESLKEYENEIKKLKRILSETDKDGDFFKLIEVASERSFGTTTKAVKLTGAEIIALENQLKKAQEQEATTLGVIEQLSGDYLDNFKKNQEKQTKATLEEAQKRATALKIPFSPEATAEEINALIIKNTNLSEERKKHLEQQKNQIISNEKTINDFLNKAELERALSKEKGQAKELLAIDQKYAALILKAGKNQDLITQLENSKTLERNNLIAKKEAENEALKEQEIKDSNERKRIIEEENRLEEENQRLIREAEEEALKLEKEGLQDEADLVRANAIIDRTKWLADQQLKIEEAKEIARLKIIGATEAEISAVKKKFQLQGKKIEAEYQKTKAENDQKAAYTEKFLNQQRTREYANMFGNISELLGKNTAGGKAAAIAQATFNTYQGVTEVWSAKTLLPEPAATIAKVASTGVVLASGLKAVGAIKNTSYARGGYTTGLGFRDKDDEVAGVVHAGEYVVPRAVLQSNDPAVPNIINYLEAKRQERNGSFAIGGAATPEVVDNPTEIENPIIEQMLVQITRLNDLLDEGISTGPVIIGDDKIRDQNYRLEELENVRNLAIVE